MKPSKSMKIGILTYFWADNPGTFLQAYCMVRAFAERLGRDRVELINYRVRNPGLEFNVRHVWLGNLIRDVKRHRMYRQLRTRHLPLSGSALTTKNTREALRFIRGLKYDMIVVGSDTILQFLPHHFANGSVPPYWLDSSVSARKVACSASSGAMEPDMLSSEQRRRLRTSIRQFSLVGVRDEPTFRLMEALSSDESCKAEFVPDPTFIFDINRVEAERYLSQRGVNLSRPLVMLHLPSSFAPRARISEAFRARGYQVVSLASGGHGDIILSDASPFEWAGLFRYAKVVLTDRFHGTVFSLKNNTPVLSMDVHKNRTTHQGHSKVRDLLARFSMDGIHYLNACSGELPSANEICRRAEIAMASFDRDAVAEKVEAMKDCFNRFVDKACDATLRGQPESRAGTRKRLFPEESHD